MEYSNRPLKPVKYPSLMNMLLRNCWNCWNSFFIEKNNHWKWWTPESVYIYIHTNSTNRIVVQNDVGFDFLSSISSKYQRCGKYIYIYLYLYVRNQYLATHLTQK